MNLKLLSITCTLAISATISGCAFHGEPADVALHYAEPFEDHDLSLEEDYNHSTAMQYMNLISRERVYKANDLDKNMDGYTNVSVRTTQSMAALGALTKSLNPFQAAFSLIGQQSNLSEIHYLYERNLLFVISPLPSLKVDDVDIVVKEADDKLINTISDAYRKNGSSVVVIESTEALNWEKHDSLHVIPLDETGGVADCYYPSVLSDIKAQVATEGYEARFSLPGKGAQGCFSELASYSHLYTSDGNNGEFLPAGNFLLSFAFIPALFPLDKLSSRELGMYLYQPAKRSFTDRNLRNHIKNNKSANIEKYYNVEGNFRVMPAVTDLSSGEVLQFGS